MTFFWRWFRPRVVLALALLLLSFSIFADPIPMEVDFDDLDQVQATAARLIQESVGGQVRILHIEGTHQDERLNQLIALLREANIDVQAVILTRADFDANLARASQQRTATGEPSAILAEFGRNPQRFRQITDQIRQLFGFVHGITITEHFVRRDEEGRLRTRFDGNPEQTRLAARLSFSGGAWLGLGLHVNGMRFDNPHYYASIVYLIGWIFTCVNNQFEFDSFHTQMGNSHFINAAHPGENQLESHRRQAFFFTSCIVKELVNNFLMIPIMTGGLSSHDLLGGGVNAIFSAFAYVPIEHYRSGLTMQAQRLRAQAKTLSEDAQTPLIAEALRLEQRARRVADLTWLIAYPILKSGHLVFGSGPNGTWWALAPLAAAGTIGFGMIVQPRLPEIRHALSRFYTRMSAVSAETICTRSLITFGAMARNPIVRAAAIAGAM